MKKSALLAVSALSLGVVGLATFTPVVSAVQNGATANITATVGATFGIGSDSAGAGALNDTMSLSAGGHAASTGKTIKVINNTGESASLSIKATTADDVNLSNGEGNTFIPGTNVEADNVKQSVWAYKTDASGLKTNWTNISATDTKILTSAEASDDVTVTYGAAASETTPAGDYTANVTYTFAKDSN